MIEELKVPETTNNDAVHTGIKAGLSVIPGGSDLFAFIFQPPIERRRNEWMNNVANAIEDLQSHIEGFNVENLAKDEQFVTVVMQTTQIALRNHQQEKIDALNNAVVNVALRNAPDEDIQLMFLQLIDSFTPWHLRILKFFDNPKEWGKQHSIVFPDFYSAGLSAVLEVAFPELGNQRPFYDLIVQDLNQRGLFATSSLHSMMSGHSLLESRTTSLGKNFIAFISNR